MRVDAHHLRASHDLQQDSYPALLVSADKFTDVVRQRSGQHPHLLRRLHQRREREETFTSGEAGETFRHTVRNRLRSIALHDQRGDTERAIDRAPTISTKVEANEEVARKKWRLDGAKLARVTHGLQVKRKEGLVALKLELLFRAEF